jgi:5-hydroxyisourate hydrolase
MIGISTHVLDTARGVPAADMPVVLEKQEKTGQWRVVGSTRTGRDGRCPQLVPDGEQLSAGVYRLVFDTENYYGEQGVRALYPIVQVTFLVSDQAHYHIPLLLNPNGYTTYRGS